MKGLVYKLSVPYVWNNHKIIIKYNNSNILKNFYYLFKDYFTIK
jgi:hypothetical protein